MKVNRFWNLVVQRDESLWMRLGNFYGFIESKYPEQSWNDFVKEMYCPSATLDSHEVCLSQYIALI
jgi:hypothetical protein